ncbi:unnamed protein product [Moneuplotes crassus]|uniref:Uncharacterized protein n=1 Tax=Euplotes crassus TaxID=5936 RepID=A0AAD2D836_EUPCR|nr:unnamed protein product [Moneuplotes crassus]
MIRYPAKEGGVANTFFHYLNLILVIADIAAILRFGFSYAAPQFLMVLSLVHLFFLFPSLLHHMFPAVRGNIVFSWFAHLIATIVLAAFVINIVLYISMMDDRYGGPAMMLILIIFTLPGALISITMLLILNTEVQNQKVRYVLIQSQEVYQPMTML